MENNESNKSLCEELFGEEVDVVKETELGKSYVRWFRDEIISHNEEEKELIKN